MSLIDFGWNEYFIAHFHSFKDKNFLPARVIRENKNNFNLICEFGQTIGILPGRLLKESDETDRPVVGDWVVIDRFSKDSNSVIQQILPRKTQVERKVPGVETKSQLIASNIDKIFIVSGLDDDFNINRIERYLSIVYDSGASPIIILNKSDLCENLDSVIEEISAIALGVPVISISALNADNIEMLEKHMSKAETIALIGSSGVGKSTLINQLLGEEKMKVNQVSNEKSKGRHTTTHRELIQLPNGSLLIDTPGMKVIKIWSDSETLGQSFSDIDELSKSCKFSDCTHKLEAGCAVLEAVENGELDERRYQNFLKLEREAAYLNMRKDQLGRHLERKKGKKFASIRREFTKNYKKKFE